ncbi:MAG: sigma 54-interacting transcriptional regulator [Hyalangium sp.]|uniref:sigma 54-interacting transcriptional regulator n=1 Tax=Hyalangium sp. TaxID=2028555 RepID=UPI00389A2B99
MVRNHLGKAVPWVLSTLAGEIPLELRREEARARLERGRGAGRATAALEVALLASLLGERAEAESFLLRSRSLAPMELEGLVELVSALVLLEAGFPARAQGVLERAEASPDAQSQPEVRALCLAFHAQALLLEGMEHPAVRAAQEAIEELPGDAQGTPLAVHAHLVAVECLLASEQTEEALALLDRAVRMPGCSGLLAARGEVLQARVGLARAHPGPVALRAILDRAIERLEVLGALRERGLAYLTYAHAVATDQADGPAHWLVRAQPLLLKVGTVGDLRQLRQAFRTLSPSKNGWRGDADVFSVMEQLRGSRARLRDILSAQREARATSPRMTPVPAPLVKVADESLESVHLAEEALIGTLEHTLLERERLGLLVVVSQQLFGIEDLEEMLVAIPKLAMGLIPAAAVGLVEAGSAGDLQWLQRGVLPPEVPLERLREAVAAALQQSAPQRVPDKSGGLAFPRSFERQAGSGRAVIPLPCQERRLCLVLELAGGHGPFSERDLEQLALFGSLCGAAISRTISSLSLRRAAARDAVTLAAIRDGLLTLSRDGTLHTLNQAAARMLRVQQEQALGRRLSELAALAPLAEVLGSGKILTGEIVTFAHGELLVRSQAYEAGVVVTLQELASAQRLAQKVVSSQARFTFEDLVGEDPAFLACLEDARLAARSDVPILITGESGTGKELLAQAIHRASPTTLLPFVGINVAAFPRELLESELFGYERGAFTGARAGGNPGKFELADRGTLLLDEIGDLPLEMQVKLLRVLQERVFHRLGGSRDIPLQARVVATTHRDLERAVEEGTFRLDLFHRLRVVHLRLPPLRERRGDIPRLVEHHLRRYASRLHRRPIQVAPHVMTALEAYDWPGNVRELANLLEGAASLLPEDQDVILRTPVVVERALQRHNGDLGPAHSSESLLQEGRVRSIEELERHAFAHALRHCGGNVAKAAKALGVAKGTFYSKIRRYGLVGQKEPHLTPAPIESREPFGKLLS